MGYFQAIRTIFKTTLTVKAETNLSSRIVAVLRITRDATTATTPREDMVTRMVLVLEEVATTINKTIRIAATINSSNKISREVWFCM